jgi:hypothetical protein
MPYTPLQATECTAAEGANASPVHLQRTETDCGNSGASVIYNLQKQICRKGFAERGLQKAFASGAVPDEFRWSYPGTAPEANCRYRYRYRYRYRSATAEAICKEPPYVAFGHSH